MRRIRSIYELKKMHMIFNKVFSTKDPFSEVFSNTIKHRIVLCPTDGYYLDYQQFNALINAAKFVGEDEYYLSEIEGNSFEKIEPDDGQYDYGHWEATCALLYEDYLLTPVALENAIYSLHAKWGVIISHESHAVVGGSEEFIEKFKEEYPVWEDGLKNFIKQWQYYQKEYNSDIEWLSNFLNYLKIDK